MDKKVGFGITTQAFWTNFLQYKVKNVIPNAIKKSFWYQKNAKNVFLPLQKGHFSLVCLSRESKIL